MCNCEDIGLLRKLIREELEKMRAESMRNGAPKERVQVGAPKINELIGLYLDNFPSDRLKPPGSTVAGQIKLVLKQINEQELLTLLPILANAGKPISAAWLNWAKDQVAPKSKVTAPTPVPPKFDDAEFTSAEAKPMPEGFRDAIMKAMKSPDDV